MFERKVLILISNNGKKLLVLLGTVILMAITLNVIIFAGHSGSLLEKKSIIIDPGHGGIDSGTTDYAAFLEKDVNLQISQKLQKALQDENALADLTRDGDYALDDRNNASESRHKRDLIARVNYFNNGKYDLFISIHVNRSSNKNAAGPIVLYSSKYPSTELLARCIQDKLNEYIKEVLGLNIRHNAVRSDYYILLNSNIPGVMVETGFISNPKEKVILKNQEYQSKLAGYIKEGINGYFKEVQNINSSNEEGQLYENPSEDTDESLPSNAPYELQTVFR